METKKKIAAFVLGTIFGSSLLLLFSFQIDSIKNILFKNGFLVSSNIDLPSIQENNNVKLDNNKQEEQKSGTDIKTFENISNILEKEYLYQDKIDNEEMIDEAIHGFVDGLDDPHTTYFSPVEQKDFSEGLSGEENFEGIGAVVQKHSDGIQIQRPIEGQPAQNAGIMALDIIKEIDDKSTIDMSLSDGVDLMRGKKGTDVKLKLFRPDTKEILEKKVTRDTINVPSVESEILENGVGYINVAVIGRETNKMFDEAIKKLKTNKVKGVVLDLRGNTGGYLDVAVDIASYFIPKGELVVGTNYANFPETKTMSNKNSDFDEIPVVVLVDGYSASGAEIIAGALRDQRDAKLVGAKTFGKGSIQTIQDLDNGGALKYTIGEWLIPSGESIQDNGITPDIEVNFDFDLYEEEKVDTQKQRAIKELKSILNN